MAETYRAGTEKWNDELSRRVLDIVIYLDDNKGRIYDEDTKNVLEDFWRRVEEAEQAGVNCEIYRTQISNMVADCRRSLLRLI